MGSDVKPTLLPDARDVVAGLVAEPEVAQGSSLPKIEVKSAGSGCGSPGEVKAGDALSPSSITPPPRAPVIPEMTPESVDVSWLLVMWP